MKTEVSGSLLRVFEMWPMNLTLALLCCVSFSDIVFHVRPMPTETRCCKAFFPQYKKMILLKIRSYRRYGKHVGEMFGCPRWNPLISRWKMSTRWSNTAHVTIDLRSRHIIINPRSTRFVSGKANEWMQQYCRWRPRRCQVDLRSRRREVARRVLRSSPTPEKGVFFLHRRGVEGFCGLFFTHPWEMSLYQTLDRRPRRNTGRVATLWPEGVSDPLTSTPRS